MAGDLELEAHGWRFGVGNPWLEIWSWKPMAGDLESCSMVAHVSQLVHVVLKNDDRNAITQLLALALCPEDQLPHLGPTLMLTPLRIKKISVPLLKADPCIHCGHNLPHTHKPPLTARTFRGPLQGTVLGVPPLQPPSPRADVMRDFSCDACTLPTVYINGHNAWKNLLRWVTH